MSMFFSNVWPRQTQPSIQLGTVTASVGITVLAWAVSVERIPLIYGMMALTGHGVGMSFTPGSLHALAYFPTMTAPISCLVAFANPFGGTVGLTLMSTVFNNRSGVDHADAKTGIMWAFVAIAPMLWLSVLAATGLGNVWIRPDGEGGHDVVYGAWLWSLIRGKTLEKHKVVKEENGEADAGDTEGLMLGEVRRGRGDKFQQTQREGYTAV